MVKSSALITLLLAPCYCLLLANLLWCDQVLTVGSDALAFTAAEKQGKFIKLKTAKVFPDFARYENQRDGMTLELFLTAPTMRKFRGNLSLRSSLALRSTKQPAVACGL